MGHAILCVDDYEAGLKIQAKVLEHAGFNVRCTTDPNSAIDLIKETHFDAVVIDFQMPGMDGAALAHLLKQQQPKLPILLLSAYPADIPKDALNWIDRFLCKGSQVASQLPGILQQLIEADLSSRRENAERLQHAAHDALEMEESLARRLEPQS